MTSRPVRRLFCLLLSVLFLFLLAGCNIALGLTVPMKRSQRESACSGLAAYLAAHPDPQSYLYNQTGQTDDGNFYDLSAAAYGEKDRAFFSRTQDSVRFYNDGTLREYSLQTNSQELSTVPWDAYDYDTRVRAIRRGIASLLSSDRNRSVEGTVIKGDLDFRYMVEVHFYLDQAPAGFPSDVYSLSLQFYTDRRQSRFDGIVLSYYTGEGSVNLSFPDKTAEDWSLRITAWNEEYDSLAQPSDSSWGDSATRPTYYEPSVV